MKTLLLLVGHAFSVYKPLAMSCILEQMTEVRKKGLDLTLFLLSQECVREGLFYNMLCHTFYFR